MLAQATSDGRVAAWVHPAHPATRSLLPRGLPLVTNALTGPCAGPQSAGMLIARCPSLSFVVPVLLAVTVSNAAAGGMIDPERQRLVAHLEMTEAWLRAEVDGLSPAQLSWRPAPATWSVKDVVEHLGIAEPQYWTQLQDVLKAPANGFTASTSDAAILWYGIDRTERTTTGDARVPDGRFKTAAEALASFSKLRAEMLRVARTTQEDLRGRRFGKSDMDAYQWFLMISTHAMRHLLQIQEVKRAPGFPKA